MTAPSQPACRCFCRSVTDARVTVRRTSMKRGILIALLVPTLALAGGPKKAGKGGKGGKTEPAEKTDKTEKTDAPTDGKPQTTPTGGAPASTLNGAAPQAAGTAPPAGTGSGAPPPQPQPGAGSGSGAASEP